MTRVADDFSTILARTEELRREKAVRVFLDLNRLIAWLETIRLRRAVRRLGMAMAEQRRVEEKRGKEDGHRRDCG